MSLASKRLVEDAGGQFSRSFRPAPARENEVAMQCFVVRLWGRDGHPHELRGEVQNAGTGEQRSFVRYATMIHCIESWCAEPESR